MADPAHVATDEVIAEIEKKLKKQYSKAAREIQEKLEKHLEAFRKKVEGRLEALHNGEITKQEYENWFRGQVATGQRWKDLQGQIADDLLNVNAIARSTAEGYKPDVYALNINYATYDVEHAGLLDTSFTLYDHETVERIMREEPALLPPPGKLVAQEIAEGKAKRWNLQIFNSVMTQGIIQGESIDKIAKRISSELSTRNYAASVRYARTAMTSAQNAGRYDGYRRARDMGVNLKIEWSATLDQRTRHDHRMLHGQRREIDEPFEVSGYKILYPAQAGAGTSDIPQETIWNCRCTLIAWVKGFENDTVKSSPKMGDLSFEEWQQATPMTKQEQDEWIRAGKPSVRDRVVKKEDYNFVSKYEEKTSLKEIETQVSRIVDNGRFGAVGVSFAGVDVEVANRVAKTIVDLYDEFSIEKFGGIIAPAGNTKLGKTISSATAAYSPIRNSFLLNRQSLKTVKVAEEAFRAEYNAVKNFLSHPEKYDINRMSTRVKRVLESSRVSGRGTVPETIEEALTHEFGHALEKQLRNIEGFSDIKDNMKKYAPSISGYAQEDISEYIAESFCAWKKGGIPIDPLLEKMFISLRRQIK